MSRKSSSDEKKKTIKKRVISILNNTFSIIDLNIQTKLAKINEQQNQPIPLDWYREALFHFLFNHSNDSTGIEFINRLEPKYDSAVNSKNLEFCRDGKQIYTRNTNFYIEVMSDHLNILNKILNENFFKVQKYPYSHYAVDYFYTPKGDEIINIGHNIQHISESFNYYLAQHNSKIRCFEIVIQDNRVKFLLGELGKFQLPTKQIQDEIKMEDNDFAD